MPKITLIEQFKKHAKANYHNGYCVFVNCYSDYDLEDFFEECHSLAECVIIADAIIAKNSKQEL